MNDIGNAVDRKGTLSRRRTLLIVGAAVGTTFLLRPASASSGTASGEARYLHRWRGQVLGAQATIQLHGMDEAAARRLIRRCVDEAARLERIFSLYLPDSDLAHLNRDGELRNPPRELCDLLSESRRISEATDGAFDVTVQALWNLYAGHFLRRGANPAGPGEAARRRALARVDYTAIEIGRRRISFERQGIAVTLNGIAQGYITDRIAELLHDHGVAGVMVDFGEIRVLGGHPSGRPWTVGLVDPGRTDRLARTVAIENAAVASSGGYGATFDPAGRNHHLFDRFSGTSANYTRGVTVIAPTATTADGLSTALSVMPHDQALGCLDRFDGARAMITMPDGSLVNGQSRCCG